MKKLILYILVYPLPEIFSHLKKNRVLLNTLKREKKVPFKKTWNFLLAIAIASIISLLNCKGEESLPPLVLTNWEYTKSQSANIDSKTFQRLEKIQDLTEISFGDKGFIFLKTKFDLPELKSDSKFSIYMDLINPTDETYLNGVWIGKTGKIPQKEGEFFSAWNEIRNYQVEPGLLKEKDNELLIKIYFEEEFSFTGKLRIGEKEKLDKLKLRLDFYRSTIYLPISFLLFVMAGFYLLVYLKRRQDTEFVYYALVAIFSGISQTNFFILKIPIDCDVLFNYFYFQKIVFASICLFPWALIQYTNRILRKEVKPYENWLFASFTILPATIFILAPNYHILTYLRVILFMIVIAFGLSYILPLVIYKTYLKHKNAKIFLLGLIPFTCCILFDLFVHNFTRNDELIYIGFLGMPSFIIAIGIVQANDFVNYRIQLEELNKSLERRVLKRTERLQLAKEEIEKALLETERIARIDPLTNLYNRLHLMKSLEVEFQKAKRYKFPFSILLMDIDYFKMINDTYGHLAGDEVLKNTGKLIQNMFRYTDIAARFGGEEFCIILPNTKKEDALIAAEKFHSAVENSVTHFNEKKIQFTCSIGITEYLETDSNFSVLIERADTALYSAKREGRNRIIIS